MKMILSQPVGSSPGLDMEQIVRSYQCRLQKSWFIFQTPEKYIYQNNLYEDKFLRGVMNILALPNCKTGTCRRCHCLFIVYAKKYSLYSFCCSWAHIMSSRSKRQSDIKTHVAIFCNFGETVR